MHPELQPVITAVVVGILFPLLVGFVPESIRWRSMAITVSVAAGAYLNGGFGLWEFAFAVAVGVCGYLGLRSYRFIALGWLLHTGWDIAHHAAGLPMISWLPTSSLECAVSDTFFAVWFLLGAPAVVRPPWAGRQDAEPDKTSGGTATCETP